MTIQQVGSLLSVFTCSSLLFLCYICSVLTADEGVISADPKQSPKQVQNHKRSSPAVSGGHEGAPSPEPSQQLVKEEPGDRHKEDEECQEDGQSPISLSLTAVKSHQSRQEEQVSDAAPSAGSRNCPSATCCERRTSDPDRTDEPSEDAGDQEDKKDDKRQENSNVDVSLLAVGSLREQVDAESSQEAEPSGETCQI